MQVEYEYASGAAGAVSGGKLFGVVSNPSAPSADDVCDGGDESKDEAGESMFEKPAGYSVGKFGGKFGGGGTSLVRADGGGRVLPQQPEDQQAEQIKGRMKEYSRKVSSNMGINMLNRSMVA